MANTKRRPLADRLWEKVEVLPNGCWRFTGRLNEGGYGRINSGGGKGRPLSAPRVAYELACGPLPAGYEPDHTCRNRACINPAHLEAVTRRENLLRGDTPMGRAARSGRCKNGHDITIPANRYERKDRPGSFNCLACHRERRSRKRNDALLCDINGKLVVCAATEGR